MQESIWTKSIVTLSVVRNLKAFSKSAKMLTLNYSSNQLRMLNSMYSGIWPMKRKTSTSLMRVIQWQKVHSLRTKVVISSHSITVTTVTTLTFNCLKQRINNLVEHQQPLIEVAKQQSLASTLVHQNQGLSPVRHRIRNRERQKISSSKPKPSP